MQEFFDPKGLAEYLGVDIGTVYNWNYRKLGPPPLKINGVVRYRRTDVEKWLESRAKVGAA